MFEFFIEITIAKNIKMWNTLATLFLAGVGDRLPVIRLFIYFIQHVRFVFFCEFKYHYWLYNVDSCFLDYVAGGELFTHLYQREHFTEAEVRIYIGEIILALEHLHSVSITVPLLIIHLILWFISYNIYDSIMLQLNTVKKRNIYFQFLRFFMLNK